MTRSGSCHRSAYAMREHIHTIAQFEHQKDASIEERIAKIANLARDTFEAPVAVLSLRNTKGGWHSASVGLEAEDLHEFFEKAFCEVMFNKEPPCFIEDASKEPDFRDNPLVAGPLRIRSCIGVPLKTSSGGIGTLCVLSPRVGAFDRDDIPTMEMLAKLAITTIAELAHQRESERRRDMLRLTETISGVGYGYFNLLSGEVFVSDRVLALQGIEDGVSERSLESALEPYPPQDREFLRHHLEQASTRGVPFDITVRLVRPDKSIRLVQIKGEPEYFEDNHTICGVFGAVRDITHEYQNKKRLAAAEKMATIGTMAAALTHEINTPLNYVMVNVNVLRQTLGSHSEEVEEMFSDIEHGLERLSQLSKDLLSFARSEHTLEETPAIADGRRALEMAIRLCSAQNRHVNKLSLSISETLPPLQIRENHLVQIAINLINNATQATPKNPFLENEILVSAYTISKERVVIEVSDSGEGIPPENLARIFEPFFTTKPEGEGSGLGLSICRQLAEEHGGTLTVTSTVGKGSTFRLTLDVARDTASQSPY